MFRKMKHPQQELSKDETVNILKNNSHGVLAVWGDDGYPYTVPLIYAFIDEDIYFCSEKQGHKIDSIQNNSKVSFCVVDQNKYEFGSVIAFATARVVEDSAIKSKILECLGTKDAHKIASKIGHITEEQLDGLSIVQLKVNHMSGKVALAFIPYANRMSPHEENGVCFEDLLLSD